MAKGLKGLLNFITGHVNPNAVESSYLRDPTLKTREDLGREMIDPTSQYYRQQRDLNMQDAMDMGASQSFLGTRNAMRMGGSQAIAGQVGQAGTRNMVQDALRSSSQEFGRGQAMGAGLLSGVSGQYQRAGAARANQMIDNAANRGQFAQSMIGMAGGMVGDYLGAKWQNKFNPLESAQTASQPDFGPAPSLFSGQGLGSRVMAMGEQMVQPAVEDAFQNISSSWRLNPWSQPGPVNQLQAAPEDAYSVSDLSQLGPYSSSLALNRHSPEQQAANKRRAMMYRNNSPSNR